MSLSFEQLQAFVAAAETGSFSAAARRLGKAQSAVSTAVANLEIDCGVSLFDRSARSPVLSQAGQALYQDAESILQRCRELQARAASFSQGVEEKLVLAVDEAMPFLPFADSLRRFESRFPHVDLEILNPAMADLAELVGQGRADLGLSFTQAFYPRDFHFQGIGYLRFVALAGAGHPLTGLDSVSAADLGDYRQLVSTARNPRLYVERMVISHRLWHLESQYGILEFVKAGFGWAFLPEHIALADLAAGRVRRLPLAFQSAEILVGVDLIWTRAKGLGKAGAWLVEALGQWSGDSTAP